MTANGPLNEPPGGTLVTNPKAMEDFELSETDAERSTAPAKSSSVLSYWLMAALLLAFSLRILLLDAQSIWWDEGISLHLALSSIGEIAINRLNNIHPPLYFILLKGWLLLVGVTAFTGRYLSAIASWLQVAVIYAVAKRWFGRRTANAALWLAAVSAISIIYGQEIRVYAYLALIYLLLLAITRELIHRKDGEQPHRNWLWLALGLLMWLGLHLHYIAFFVAAYVSAWALIVFIRQRRWPDLRRWLLVLYLVAMASLPWFLAVWRNWMVVAGEAAAGTFTTEPVPFAYLVAQVWVFHLTGLAGALARPGMAAAAAALATLLLLLVLMRLIQKGTRRNTAVLLANWLIPLSSALIVWTLRSFAHPRYVAMFAPGLILLAAYVTFPPQEHRGRRQQWIPNFLSVLLYLTMIGIYLWGLWLYFVDPEVAKDDVRGAAHYLESEAGANDLILIPDTDWSLPFEYHGDAAVAMPGLDDDDRKWLNLETVTTGVDRVYLLEYENGTRDWQGLLPFALRKAGTLESSQSFNGLDVRTYVLEEAIREPEMQPERVHWGPLMLTGSWIEQDGFAGDAMTVALRWTLLEPMEMDGHISLRLLDEAGWPVAAKDDRLVDEYGRTSQYWPTGTSIFTYHVVELPPATPPFAYDVEVHAYVEDDTGLESLNVLDEQGAPMGQSAVIGASHVAYRNDIQLRGQADLPLAPWPEAVQLAPGLSLLAAEVPTTSALPGDALSVRLLWQAAADVMPEIRPEVALVRGPAELDASDEDPVYGKYPVSVWSNGEQVIERRILTIPAAASGEAAVILRAGEKEIELGKLNIQGRDHTFIQPASEYAADALFGGAFLLVGFDLPQKVFTSGENIPLKLLWKANSDGSETEYVFFTHLLDDEGRVIAQHDSVPTGGQRPTSSWLAGEYIADEHLLQFLESGYTGTAKIEIGIYDPISGERLQLQDGSDHLLLPVQIRVK